MKYRIITTLLFLAVLCGMASAKETFVFDVAGNDTLRLDVYPAKAEKPGAALIFAFGGSFKTGQRDDARYLPFFDYLADNGVTVVSTDYRTKLKNVNPANVNGMQGVVDLLTDAIGSAVSDYLKATAFTVAHAKAWNIDPTKIFACGSSAGAITVLQAENELCNATTPLPGFAPDFNYAGIISFAGAVFCYGEPYWRKNPAPMLLFHGNADSNVPYKSATIDNYGLWGSEAIANELKDGGHKVWFHRVIGADHSVAISPMDNDKSEVLDFIKAVSTGKIESKDITEDRGNTSYNTNFSIQDYIMSNFH